MFDKIAKDVLDHCKKVTLTITGNTEKMTVVMFPEFNNDVKGSPARITGTPEEVTTEFHRAIEMIFVSNKAALSNVDAVAKEVAENAKKAAEKKAASTTTSSSSSSTAKKEDKPTTVDVAKLKGEEKKAWLKVLEMVTKAKTARDPDVVAYLEKQATTEVVKVKSVLKLAKSELAEKFKEIKDGKKDEKVSAPDGMFANSPAGDSKPAEEETKTESTTPEESSITEDYDEDQDDENNEADNDDIETDEDLDINEVKEAEKQPEPKKPEPKAEAKPEPKPAPAPTPVSKAVVDENDIF